LVCVPEFVDMEIADRVRTAIKLSYPVKSQRTGTERKG
jgi:stage V sporulation protein SpoVS